jgi:large subunit ribosomal protein L10
MPRQEKIEKVRGLSERFRRANGAVFAEYRGLTVKDTVELRRALREADTSFAIVKNTLTKRAVKDAGLDDAASLFEGPTAVAFMSGDAVRGAKALLDLTRRFPALVVKGALIEGRILWEDDARSLATIDAKEISLAKVAGLLWAPLTRLAYVLQAPLSRIAYALAERARQGGAGPDGGTDPGAEQAAEPEPGAGSEGS